jgi:CheY-like chemotaxis protein
MNCADNFSILVVEDSDPIRDLICLILEEDGYHVESACNGKDGFELFTQKRFDMVFTDLKMPVMTGCEMAEKIKATNKHIPIVLVTAWAMDCAESELRNKGIDYIIQKPFQDIQLLQLVRNEMETKEIPMSLSFQTM